jgi:hypothetical protein
MLYSKIYRVLFSTKAQYCISAGRGMHCLRRSLQLGLINSALPSQPVCSQLRFRLLTTTSRTKTKTMGKKRIAEVASPEPAAAAADAAAEAPVYSQSPAKKKGKSASGTIACPVVATSAGKALPKAIPEKIPYTEIEMKATDASPAKYARIMTWNVAGKPCFLLLFYSSYAIIFICILTTIFLHDRPTGNAEEKPWYLAVSCTGTSRR